MASQFSICILSREVPLDGSLFGVLRLLPSVYFRLQKLSTGNTPIQPLTAKYDDLDLGHVEPARVLGCVVKLHTTKELRSCTLVQHIVKALSEVGVEVVQHQVNSARLGIYASEQPIEEGDEGNFSPVGSDRDDVPNHPAPGLEIVF